jgi:hypothetical protein
MLLVRDDLRRVYYGRNIDNIMWNDDEVECATMLVSGTQDSLSQAERVEEFGQTNGIRVDWVFNVDVEVTTHDERTPQQTDGLELGPQVVEKCRAEPGR